jgi:hypothetical protein
VNETQKGAHKGKEEKRSKTKMTMELYRKKSWGRETTQRRSQTEKIIFAALDQVEAARQRLQSAQRDLAKAVDQDPDGEWTRIWDEFLAAGGMTRDELCRWMVTRETVRSVAVKRSHLRLISHGHAAPVFRMVRRSDPPEAA